MADRLDALAEEIHDLERSFEDLWDDYQVALQEHDRHDQRRIRRRLLEIQRTINATRMEYVRLSKLGVYHPRNEAWSSFEPLNSPFPDAYPR